jgi:hypothetical protein
MKFSVYFLILGLSILQACGGSNGGGDPGAGTEPPGNNPQSLSLNSIGNKSVLAGESLSFTLSANDPNGTSHTYTADGTSNSVNPLSLTNEVSFNESSGAFVWNTSVNEVGVYNIVFAVSNNASPMETDSESVTINVQSVIAYGKTLYDAHCKSCHGPDGVGGTQTIVQGASPLDVKLALGMIPPTPARSGMGGIASQFENQTRDANAIGFYLCDAAQIDYTDTVKCPVN